jgi:ubiquinone/menaquinone biosynthesis C-methylase UbiE
MRPSPFDMVANSYDKWYEENTTIFHMEIEAIERLGLKGRGLDIGGGTGLISARVGGDVCLDLSRPMLREAMRRGLHSVQGLAEALPFRDGSFDFVLMSVALSFLDEPERALEEAHRVLIKGGTIGLCIVPRDSAWGQYYIDRGAQARSIYSHAKFLTVADLRELMVRTSFHVERMISTLHLPPGEDLTKDKVITDDSRGGFVCIKGRRSP